MEFGLIISFIIIFTIAVNSMVAMGLISKVSNIMRSERIYRTTLFALYVSATFTTVFVSEQLTGIILLSFLPMLTLYQFSNNKTIMYAIISHPLIVISYYWAFNMGNDVVVSIGIVASSYTMLLIALYVVKRFQNNRLRMIVCGVMLAIFETLGQAPEYNLSILNIEFRPITLLNIIGYLVAIKFIEFLYSIILKVEEADYQEKYIDTLTNLHNFKAFSEDYNGALKENDYLMAVIDIDHFKKINDTYGHAIGNAILERLSDFLADNLNAEYAFLDYKVYRYGGEEIIITVKNYPNMILDENGQNLIKILHKVNNTLGDTSEKLIRERVSFSGGVTAYSLSNYSDEQTFERADELLYQAKEKPDIVILSDIGLTISRLA